MASGLDRDTKNFVRKKARKAWGKKETKPYESGATVVSAGDKPMVKLDGSDKPIEATLFMDSKRGDRVHVKVSKSGVKAIGNQTRPTASSETANRADLFAQRAYKMADNVTEKVEEAYEQAAVAYQSASEASVMAKDARETVDGIAGDVADALDAAEVAAEKADIAKAAADEAAPRADHAYEVATNAINRSVAAENTINSLNVRIGEGDDESLIRMYGGGVLAGRVPEHEVVPADESASDLHGITALVNASGSFDVVETTWIRGTYETTEIVIEEDGTISEVISDRCMRYEPSVGSSVASFGEVTTIGKTDKPHVSISASGMTLYGDVNGSLMPTAKIEGDRLKAKNAEVEDYLILGEWRLYKRAVGDGKHNFSLKYTGAQ